MKIPAKWRPRLVAALAAAMVLAALSWHAEKPASAPQADATGRTKAAAPRTGRERMEDELEKILAACEAGADPEEIRRSLAALKRRWLQEEDLHLLATMSAQFLRSGTDAQTGIAFEVGKGRALKGWPTMRIFLLDLMAVADPDLACEVGREVLASTGSAEEFAVALKPLTMSGPWRASDAELEGHFAAMLGKAGWQESAGLAEALDLARILATPAATATLAQWLEHSPGALQTGSMALHETAAEHPGLVLDLIAEQSALFEDQSGLRASLMARGTVSDAGQSAILDDYLRNPAVSVQEKREFLAIYPLRSATTGYRLYGSQPAPYERSAVTADDQAALEAVSRWKADPGLADLLPEMGKLEGRLQTWVRQAAE